MPRANFDRAFQFFLSRLWILILLFFFYFSPLVCRYSHEPRPFFSRNQETPFPKKAPSLRPGALKAVSLVADASGPFLFFQGFPPFFPFRYVPGTARQNRFPFLLRHHQSPPSFSPKVQRISTTTYPFLLPLFRICLFAIACRKGFLAILPPFPPVLVISPLLCTIGVYSPRGRPRDPAVSERTPLPLPVAFLFFRGFLSHAPCLQLGGPPNLG